MRRIDQLAARSVLRALMKMAHCIADNESRTAQENEREVRMMLMHSFGLAAKITIVHLSLSFYMKRYMLMSRCCLAVT